MVYEGKGCFCKPRKVREPKLHHSKIFSSIITVNLVSLIGNPDIVTTMLVKEQVFSWLFNNLVQCKEIPALEAIQWKAEI